MIGSMGAIVILFSVSVESSCGRIDATAASVAVVDVIVIVPDAVKTVVWCTFDAIDSAAMLDDGDCLFDNADCSLNCST